MDLAVIMEELDKFQSDRGFEHFHSTKGLSTSICIKAASLLETFQCSNDENIEQIINNDKAKIEEKLADIVIYLMHLCRNLNISSDSIEATIYARIIKENINMQMPDQNENSNSKVVAFKRLEKSIVISFISSTALTALFPAFMELAQLA